MRKFYLILTGVFILFIMNSGCYDGGKDLPVGVNNAVNEKSEELSSLRALTDGESQFFESIMPIRTGCDPDHAPETWIALPTDTVLTGIVVGCTVNDNIRTMRLYGRRIQANGYLALVPEPFTGNSTNPYGGYEVNYQCPSNFIIVGLSASIYRHDFRTFRVWYREYDPITKKLIGPLKEKWINGSPSDRIEATWEPGDEYEYFSPEVRDRMLITGVGMRANRDTLTTLILNVSTLKQ